MTYFGFLLRFIIVPIILVGVWLLRNRRRGKSGSDGLSAWPLPWALGFHVVIALIYTTPWDNYLVATAVWWYDPALVTGFTIGWVPIEEYTFFVLQPLLVGLWIAALVGRQQGDAMPLRSSLRWWTSGVTAALWLAAVAGLVAGWQPGTYLALELAWALPPIALQLAFGADILWRHRRLVVLSVLPATLYLSFADALAINWGTWTINPQQSVGIYLGGVLPVEEFIFFLLTNTLVTFGMVLVLAAESHLRLSKTKALLPST